MSICVGCGLCCDGTLFSTVDLKAQEPAEALTLSGIAVYVTDAGGRQFSQPCTAFTGESCAVYADRPTVCRTFTCRLFDEVEAGNVAVADAGSIIEQARALRDAVRPELVALLGSGTQDSLRNMYGKLTEMVDGSPDRPAFQREHADLLFSIVALRRLLAGEFEPLSSTDEVRQAGSGSPPSGRRSAVPGCTEE